MDQEQKTARAFGLAIASPLSALPNNQTSACVEMCGDARFWRGTGNDGLHMTAAQIWAGPRPATGGPRPTTGRTTPDNRQDDARRRTEPRPTTDRTTPDNRQDHARRRTGPRPTTGRTTPDDGHDHT
ncbi:hypothetical protein Bbelb_385040 [Branchiostoma belcheri]|nr:hypothetical protein Bbelb_385040 [Branchiostoma belcheri]